jgi:glyoxylase-like metal-dependent hydrolase (beta-lactamase superfamily II)
LIDTEMPGYSRRLIAELEKEGVTGENLKLVFLTHGHVDHVGNAEALREHFGSVIAIGRADSRLIEEADHTFPKAHNLITKIMRFFVMIAERKYRFRPFKADIFLEDNQDLSGFGMDGAVVSLRGHTPGSAGLVIGGHIFTGDAAMRFFGRTIPSVFGENEEEMRTTLKKITKYKKENIHNGH